MAGITGKYEGIDPRLLNILEGVSQELEIPLQVNSGYRPGDSGQHGSRLAADIQTRHLSDEQKAALVRKAHELGATRFITYDTSGHLHIDLSEANGPFWPMHTPAGTGPKGGSNRHMGSAPQWYQDTVAQIQGAPQAPQIDPRTASTDPTMAGPAVDPNMLPSTAADMNGPDAMFDPTALNDQQLIQLGILPSKPQPSTNQMAQQPGFFNDPIVAMGMGILGNPSTSANVSIAKGYQAAQQAMRQQQLLDQDLARTQSRSAAKIPANIQEILLLKRMYPNLSDEDVLQMAFTGAIRGPGEELRQVGSVTVRRDRDQFGRPTDRPVDTGTQEVIEQRTEDVSQAGERGTQLGRMEVETVANTGQALVSATSGLNSAQQLLDRFESGEFNNATGPIRGRLGQFFSPDTAQVQAMEMTEALRNLGIENLAPVSNYEIDLIRKMYAGSFSTPAQNKAILRDLVRIREAKVDVLQRTMERLRNESIEEYIRNPEVIRFTPSDVPSDSEAAPSTAPGTTMGYDPDDINRQLDEVLQ